MKILRLTTLLDFGGQEKQYISFTEKPELLQHQYVFAAIGYGGHAERVLTERGFEVRIMNQNFSVKNLKNVYTLYRLIREVKPDIVHTAAAEANFHGIIAAKMAGVKTIVAEEIGIPNHSSAAQKIFRHVYRLADKVVCVSRSVKDYLVTIKEIPEAKGQVIYNPVSFPKKFPKTKTNNHFNMVYVGRLGKVKNVQMLIRAFSRLIKQDVRLTVVGNGSELENLKMLADELQCADRVIFTGFVKEPSKFLANADLFVLPSFSEGFGIAAVEAMLLKVPVLCSNVGGIPEFVHDGENGWLFSPTSEEELSDKLNHIVSCSEDYLVEMGTKGYASVADLFTVQKYISNLERFYDDTAG
ncbi:glycosyltransferase [Epilithonimonas hominis]|uniref:glycosyltransferase n=1 Tax=Epilithonimonas hominis TaxID=420404 RepID=UPI00289E0852|nr:glycosyltransferase [Epilithonimonas hominis]